MELKTAHLTRCCEATHTHTHIHTHIQIHTHTHTHKIVCVSILPS